MSCHEYFNVFPNGVATKMLKTFSFICFSCTHDNILDITHLVFLPNSPQIASKKLTTCSSKCFVCNGIHVVSNEIAFIAFSTFLGVFEFPHFDDVPTTLLHLDLAYALLFIYLCCANGAMNKIGHVLHDVFHFHAHTKFAWSLVYRYYNRMNWHEWLPPQNAMKDNLAHREHRNLAKVTSFYISDHAMTFKDWLLVECRVVLLMSLIGYMKAKGTMKRSHTIYITMVTTTSTSTHLPPRLVHEDIRSWTTFFQGGGGR